VTTTGRDRGESGRAPHRRAGRDRDDDQEPDGRHRREHVEEEQCVHLPGCQIISARIASAEAKLP
jgi:hypothetical protein